MIATDRYRIYLELDPAPHPGPDARKYFGFARSGLAALSRSLIIYGGGERNAALSSNFFDGLQKRWHRDRQADSRSWRQHIVEAAEEAVAADPEFAERGNGYLLFTVLVDNGAGWSVFQLGANFVFHLAGGACYQVVIPQSATQQLLERGVDPRQAYEECAAATAGVEPGKDFEPQIRQAELRLNAGEWLLVAPPSPGILDLDLSEQPRTPDALRTEVIEVLAAARNYYERSWLAVGAI